LRENVWYADLSQDTAELVTSSARYEVPLEDTLDFLKMRSYCTGHHAIEAIAERSGLVQDRVVDIVDALEQLDVLGHAAYPSGVVDVNVVRDMLQRGCALWGEELEVMHFCNGFLSGDLPPQAGTGWLTEAYHMSLAFPSAFTYGAECASGRLAQVIRQYAEATRGRERAVLESLERLGVSPAEVEGSTPMLSTRLIDFLMRELFSLVPESTLAVATVLEAGTFDVAKLEALATCLQTHYGLAPDCLAPWYAQQRRIRQQGRADILAANLELIAITDLVLLNRMTNQLHDLIHTIFLQGRELQAYYGPLYGAYLLRHPMTFEAI
jgi:hypothetical protein